LLTSIKEEKARKEFVEEKTMAREGFVRRGAFLVGMTRPRPKLDTTRT
jgi:hypothetical protein